MTTTVATGAVGATTWTIPTTTPAEDVLAVGVMVVGLFSPVDSAAVAVADSVVAAAVASVDSVGVVLVALAAAVSVAVVPAEAGNALIK